MKKIYSDFILLSAYLDNELSDLEKEYIEKKLSTSIELRNKLEELRRIKNLSGSCHTELKENEYFEQKVLSTLLEDKPKFSFNKRWLPAFGIVAVLLLVFFSVNLNPEFFKSFIDNYKDSKSNYQGNLKPLFLPSDLNGEDLFNFAIYEELPLNSADNRVLKIGIDNSGKEYFILKKSDTKTIKNNLNNFLANLNLTENKKSKIDSLFKDYALKLSKNILVGDNNSIAINSSVWNLRKAMVADFIALTRQLDTKNFDRLALAYNLPIPKNFIAWDKKLDSIHTNKYIVFTPDSVFTSELALQIKDFPELYSENIISSNYEHRFHKIDLDSLLNQFGSRIKITKNPDFVHIQIEEIEIPDIQIPDFNSLVEMIEKTVRNQPNLNLVTEGNPNRVNENRQRRAFVLPQNDVNLDSVMEEQNRRFENTWKKKAEPKKNNSNNSQVSPKSELQDDDVNEEIRIELEKLREEIENFRKQFKNFLKEDSTKNKLESINIIDNIEI